MSEFDTLWREIISRGVITVQDYTELQYIFDLMKAHSCESYLEIGTAEGNSLYILSHALTGEKRVHYVDFGEKHTTPPRNELLAKLNIKVGETLGNSNLEEIANQVPGKFDVVLIDAGHSYENVLKDAMLYGPKAKKFIVFHDVQLEEVKSAFDWYVKYRGVDNVQHGKKYHTFINSQNFGYGIIEV